MRTTTVEARSIGNAAGSSGSIGTFTSATSVAEMRSRGAPSPRSCSVRRISGLIDNNGPARLQLELRGAVGAGRLEVSSRLTLNGGFRWDFNSPLGEKQTG